MKQIKVQKRKYLYQIASFTYQELHVDYLIVSLSVDFQLMNPDEMLSLYTIFDGEQNHLLCNISSCKTWYDP